MNKDQNNIELVISLYDFFSQKDINKMLGILSPELICIEPKNPYNPAGGIKIGHAGFLEWLNIGKQTEEILILKPQKFLTDIDSVAVTGYMKCQSKQTGKTYESDFVHLFTIKNNKIIRFQEYFDTYLAAEAFR